MKIVFTQLTLLLSIVWMASYSGQALAATKPSGGSVSGDLVISKVFYNNMMNDAGKAYILANYLELYNNSDKELDISGIYIGFSDNTSSTANDYANAWTAVNMAEVHSGMIALVQIFRIPTGKTYTLQPGESVVICNSAIDHTTVASKAPNLSGANFEVKSSHSAYAASHNDAVPELPQVFSYNSNSTYIQWMSPGPSGVVLLAADTKVDDCETGYYKGSSEGTKLFKFVPAYKTLDVVDIVEHSAKTEPNASQKRMPADYDAGWVAHVTPGGNTGEAVMRKTAFVTADGRTVLFDTNNSSVDFEVTTDLSIRTYDETVAGLDETLAITIPESGYVAINPEKPFCGPEELTFSYVNVTNNNNTTDMTYYEFAGNDRLLIAGPWVAIGQPGTYQLKLSESQGVMRTRSSGMTWSDEDSKTLSGSMASRMIYKFQNEKGAVGFKRVAAVDGKYNQATFSDGDRLYYALTTAIADKIAAANGATDNTYLDFIEWHGAKPSEGTGIAGMAVAPAANSAVVYNLHGQRLAGPQRGLNIVGGKKVLVK